MVQECEKGVHRWIEIPAEGQHADELPEPAPALLLTNSRQPGAASPAPGPSMPRILLTLLLWLAAAPVAVAHATLWHMAPPADAELAAPPGQVVLRFNGSR